MKRWLCALLTAVCLAWTVPVWSGEPEAAPVVAPAPADAAVAAPVVAPDAVPVKADAAAEVTTPAATAVAPKPTPEWVQIVVAVIGSLITLFLLPYLKRQAAAAKANAAKLTTEKKATEIEMRGVLVSRLKSFLWGSAAAMAEREIPKIAKEIKAGSLTNAAQVKKALYGMGGSLRNDAIAYFKNQGVDVLAAVGDEFLDKLIERAANEVSPFPGKETAVALLTDNITDLLIEKGVDYVRAKYLSEAEVIDAQP